MRRRSTALVAGAVALAGLAVGVGVDVLDDGDSAESVATDDPCVASPPLVAVAGIVVPEEIGMPRVTVIRPDGSRAVVTGDWVASHPEISPAGDRLVVTRADGDDESAGPESETLWTIGLDGSDPVPVTTGPVHDTAAAWSPDGATIAFVRATARTTRVMAVPASGGDPVELVPAEGLDRVEDLDWSPDGSRLAFVRRSMTAEGAIEATELWTVAADGTGPTRTATLDDAATILDWHPDGSRILVSSYAAETDGSIASIDLATGGSTVVARDATDGRWSRRGTAIVHRTRTGVTQETSWKLVESTFAGGALADTRDLDTTDLVSAPLDIAVAPCAP